jgi:hypothetical protein
MIYSKQLKMTIVREQLQPEQPVWHVPWRFHHSTNYATPLPRFLQPGKQARQDTCQGRFSSFCLLWGPRPQKSGGRGCELNLACSTIIVLFVCSHLAESARVKHLRCIGFFGKRLLYSLYFIMDLTVLCVLLPRRYR